MKKRILVVEDNSGIRNYLVSLFTQSGYHVDAAPDGHAGLSHANSGGYSAIILDLKMPQTDGLSFLKKIKKSDSDRPNGPIIIYSSAEYNYAREEALKSGAAEFIKKDELDSSHLLKKVESIIQSASNPHVNKNS